jgi:RNA polymerase sigma-70 factor, ECF subfamily
MSRPAQRPVTAPASTSASLGDAEVVARVLAGDAALFEILMRRHNQRLFRVARSVVTDDAEAEDVLQEAWVRAFHALDGWRGEASVATWLARITLHEALGSVRRARRLVVVEGGGEPPEPPDRSSAPERSAENRELRGALRAALDQLPEPLRVVFVLREVEGLSGQETADLLDISPENARVRLHRAKADLRRRLDERLGREVRRLYLFDGARCDRIVAGVLDHLGPG